MNHLRAHDLFSIIHTYIYILFFQMLAIDQVEKKGFRLVKTIFTQLFSLIHRKQNKVQKLKFFFLLSII